MVKRDQHRESQQRGILQVQLQEKDARATNAASQEEALPGNDEEEDDEEGDELFEE
jgi:hypothetical protein